MAKGKESKPHIGIFGRRNNGKSSLINALVQQEIAIVSDFAGTTTDPVKKSIELEELGPVVLVDTGGVDDSGELGEKRVKKTLSALKIVDLAVLVVSNNAFDEPEQKLVKEFLDFDTPFIIVHNKSDIQKLHPDKEKSWRDEFKTDVIDFSALNNKNPERVIDSMRKYMPENIYQAKSILGDVLQKGDVVLLITPIDSEAPEGRMILPQVQAIRDILDNDCVAVVLKEDEMESFVKKMSPKPALAITDSQVFPKADAAIPKDVPLTSFSTMLARHKGDFENYMRGTPHLAKLKKGDRVLILESCSHHVSCEDIGRVKIPNWLNDYVDEKLDYEIVAGLDDLPHDICDYAMVIQCGGCVITKKQIVNRLKPAIDAGIPVTNYGMAIAYINGIYERAIAPFVKE
ncbi:MAG: [FeFe] hydrogenase H-cluster maturation GTPase HydF [Bacteroidota bacterium]|nr:[FeFe] hydrogenase H-cluster maturation GTPase HydF [Bacteroidota bacterium]